MHLNGRVPLALNLCIGAIRISYVCQCAIKHRAVTRAVAQKERRFMICGVASRKRNYFKVSISYENVLFCKKKESMKVHPLEIA